jgi:CheY-like chemotaxis protein
MSVLILEDDASRARRFRDALRVLVPSTPVHVWTSAKAMLLEIEKALPNARLISLDHDLYTSVPDAADPGDGWEVAQFLAEQSPVCPVIVHTSNAERSRWMVGELELAKWTVRAVAPVGDDWIETAWVRTAKRLLAP